MNIKLLKNTGQALVELMVAIGLVAVILPAILTGMVASREGKAQEAQRLQATAYLRELEEATRNVREKSWNSFPTSGTYHSVVSGTGWDLASGVDSTSPGFQKQVDITSVQRDSSGNIGTGTTDTSTLKLTYTVSWTAPIAGLIDSSEYFTRYINNEAIAHTTQADFDAGTKNNTQSTSAGGGAIELIPATNTHTFTDDYTNASDYNFDSNKIEVTGSYAQLKSQGGSSGQTTNPGFDTNANGWTFTSYGNNVSQNGSWQSSGGNPGGYIQVNFPADKNKKAGGYYYQAFTTTAANPTGTLSFDWRVTGYQATPDSFHLYAWIDTGLGTPVIQVWDSGNISSTSSWSGTVTINATPYITIAGTYYLKVGAYLDYQNGQTYGPYTLGFDNVLLSWSGGGDGSYPTDSPTIDPKSSLQPVSVTSWDSFSATEVTGGGSIRYQLSDDDGATWQYWRNPGQSWVTAVGATDYNDAAVVNQRINTFPVTNGKIRVKAFLISDGTQFVRLDKITIGYTGNSGINNGTFISATINPGQNVAFNRFIWSESVTANCTVKFQLAINTDNATWNYFGSDGTSSTYYTGGNGTVPLNLINGQYLKYQIYFSSTNTDICSVSDVSVNYSP